MTANSFHIKRAHRWEAALVVAQSQDERRAIQDYDACISLHNEVFKLQASFETVILKPEM